MVRPLRIEFPGAVYHITSRGNAKDAIFLDPKDYRDFLEILCSVVERYNWMLYAYCLMSNHYHLLIETPDGNLSYGMRQLNGLYSQHFNRRYKRAGHVFQGRYKAILVDKDNYLLELCRYVVLNPVRAGLVEDPKEWRWSSYKGTLGQSKEVPSLATDWILSQFGRRRKEALVRYTRFIHAGVKEGSWHEDVKGQLFLGGDGFIEKFKEMIEDREKIKEIPKAQRYVTRPSLEKIFKAGSKRLEDKLVYEAHVRYGYTLKEIAEYHGVHYTTISRAVKRMSREMVK